MSQALQRTGGDWGAYAQLARELDAVRAAEAARTAGIRQAVAQMSEHADGLEARLQAQQVSLTQLGRQLRFRTGKLQADKIEPVVEPAPLLSEVAADIDRVDQEANEAADRGRYPALLPRWSSFTRNLLIYGVAAPSSSPRRCTRSSAVTWARTSTRRSAAAPGRTRSSSCLSVVGFILVRRSNNLN